MPSVTPLAVLLNSFRRLSSGEKDLAFVFTFICGLVLLRWTRFQAECFFKNVASENAAAQGRVQTGRLLAKAALTQVPQHPACLFRARFVCLMAVEDIEIRNQSPMAEAEIQHALDASPQRFFRNGHEFRVSQRGDDLFAIFRRVAEGARFEQGRNQDYVFLRAPLGKVLPDHQDLFRVPRRQLRAGRYAPTGAQLRSNGSPGLADTKTVDESRLAIPRHLRS